MSCVLRRSDAKKKVRLSPVFSYVPCNEDVYMSGGLAPCIYSICTKWKRMLTFRRR